MAVAERDPNGAAPAMLLIVWHSRTGASEALARAAYAGALLAGEPGDARAPVCLVGAADATVEQFLAASGYLFVCPENLGTMSGAMKEMFDRCYYPLLGRIEGRAYATIIAAGSDGTGAQAQLDRIVKGWRLRRVTESVIVNVAAQTPEAILAPKVIPGSKLAMAEEIAHSLAEGLRLGIF